MTPRRIMRLPEVTQATGLQKSRINELENKGLFPRRRKISDRASGWYSDEIAAWVDSRPIADGAAPVSKDGEPLSSLSAQKRKREASAA